MDHFELVEKLREKANVSYEEAKAALEASDWDLLDALVLLENEGKVKREKPASYSTAKEEPKAAFREEADKGPSFWSKLWESIKRFVRRCNRIQFVVTRDGNKILNLPLTILIVLLIILPINIILLAVALIVGLFFGLRYSFEGEAQTTKINEVLSKTSDKIIDLKDEFMKDDQQNRGSSEK